MVSIYHSLVKTNYGRQVYLQDVRLLSTDTKPVDSIANGSTCIEIDTGKAYLYDAAGSQWKEIPSGSSVVIDPARGVDF